MIKHNTLSGLLTGLLILATGISSTSASLVSYWSFNETGSPAIDSVSGYNLSGPATFGVSGVSGVAGNAVSINSSLGQGLSTP